MPRTDSKEIDRLNGYSHGYGDHPKRDRCPFDFKKNPEAHTAYWEGWAAADADAAKESQG
ncbi:hypothetical protein [Tardiphaga sp. 285_C5_N1_2]|uniref:hypothetical protein n=1 Tax=Tardiphaga sp. 285_C5_N1_2 TaxID=3240775 RepID=UPI003F8A04B1